MKHPVHTIMKARDTTSAQYSFLSRKDLSLIQQNAIADRRIGNPCAIPLYALSVARANFRLVKSYHALSIQEQDRSRIIIQAETR